MTEPKECPFCGNEKVSCYEAWPHYWACQCDKCGASLAKHGSKEEAIETWNTRAESEQEKCNRERLVQIGEAVAKKEPIHFLAGETYVPERTCHMTLKKSGPYYDVWYFDCCEKEWAEPRCDSNIVDYPGFVCPWCGAKVVE